MQLLKYKGYVQTGLERDQEAMEAFDISLKLINDVRCQQGQYREASKLFSHCLKFSQLKICQCWRGNKNEAVCLFKNAIELAPEF
jgi:tetratricopeptide (TPR) repeat protein